MKHHILTWLQLNVILGIITTEKLVMNVMKKYDVIDFCSQVF